MQLLIEKKLSGFLQQEGLPISMLDLLDSIYFPLTDHIAALKQTGIPLFLGINGGQGSGKSTTAAILCLLLEQAHGLRSATLSIDDLYLTKSERERLAQEVHPLFITRGVPGTHDIVFGNQIFDQVSAGRSLTLPVFDKQDDDRVDSSRWQSHESLDILILEGWCVGCLPQDDAQEPINKLEQEEDPDGIWRSYVNICLQKEYAKFFSRLDSLIMLAVPSMEKIYEWRELQEEKLEKKQGGRGMSVEEVQRFIMHYERLTQWMLQEMPQRADILIPIGDDHAPKELIFNKAG